MITYDDAIKCPRCDEVGSAKVTSGTPRDRLMTCSCADKTCSFYGRTWFVILDPNNRVLYHSIYHEEELPHD
jgi:hypothetical protein